MNATYTVKHIQKGPTLLPYDEFYTKMLVACANSVSNISDRKKREKMHEKCKKWANIYYQAVSVGGSSSYKNRQNLNCECACP